MKAEYRTIRVDIKNDCALLTLDNPPVNQLSDPFVQELIAAYEAALAEDAIQAVVLTGTGNNFIAGADITQIRKVTTREDVLSKVRHNNRFLNAVETGRKPVIAAINGNCLGGGLEIAMCCHYRLAVRGIQLGQPEVQIGLIPGAGGTQRLPRLIGLPKALELITTGKPVKAEKAFALGLVDEVVEADHLTAAALAAAARFNTDEIRLKSRVTRDLTHRLPSAAEKRALINVSRSMAQASARGYIAPFKAIDAFEKGLGFDMDAGLRLESELFADCAVSDVAKNLMGIFLNTRAAGRLPRIEDIQPARIKKVVVLGGGVMGSGIVNCLLNGGFDTVLWEIDDTALEKGLAAIRKTFAYPLKKGKLKPIDLKDMLDRRLQTTTSLDDCKDVDLVIEAVLEDMEVKKGLWQTLDTICRQDVVFATNTSALPISEMATVLKDPARMLGLHFFNPAHRMRLLEIICARRTADRTLATSVALARSIKKIPIVVNDGPGFYVSRQLSALMGGSVFIMADGVDVAAIEAAMVDFGMPMGPAALADLTGIDINYHVAKTFAQRLGSRYKLHPLTEAIYRTGCYGRKTGAGYFDYSGEQPVPNPTVATIVASFLKEHSVRPRTATSQEIVDLMLAKGINEAAYMIEEGICDRPRDMDLAMIYGTGFPPYRGGILRYADKWGLRNVHTQLLALEKKYGEAFKPAGRIEQMAANGSTFYQD